MPVGIAMGVYDMTHRYLTERHQFGTPLAGIAINQEKLMRMLGGVQASFMLVLRLTRLREDGRMTPGMSSLVKAWVSKQCREVRTVLSPPQRRGRQELCDRVQTGLGRRWHSPEGAPLFASG